ncbi:hypothetical protein BCR36DRAFT_65493 [Piromyces finnis]|uniref:Uncharacterized protein n=1 Tax=Piromyces finnis TaxID=1754191 RepID=A0A1Y1V9K5_9FUNG|nr:hypothetical protein BCR36DRAFT_65493 [Piromyces finnis]|eukprot:ORX49705.1 hypothetical protein BCR36DRAFT_65493 [Piromyces finnis]
MDQYSRGYNPNWYSHKYNQDNKNGNNSKINKNTYDLKQKSDYNYYNRSSNSKSGYNERSYDYNNGNIGLSRDSKDRIKYYEPEGSSNQWNSSSNSSSTSNRNSFYRPNQRLSSGLSMKKIESITSEQSLPRSNSVPKLNSSTLGYFKTPNRIDINSHTRTYTSEKYYDEKPKENYLTNSNSKTSSDNTNKFDQEFPALGATKKTETPKFSRPYSQNYSITGSNLNNNSGSSTNTWSNSTSQTSNNGYKSYNSIVNNRLSNGNSNLSNGNASRTWDKKSNSYDSPQSQRTDSTASNNYSSNNYSNENSYNNQNQSVGTSYNGSNTNSLSSTPTPITSVSVNGGFAAAAAVSSTINTNVESSNSELMKLRQLVPKVSSQSSRSKNNYSRAKANQTRPLATQNRRSTTPVGLKISLSSDVINSISSSKLHTSAPSSPKSSKQYINT